MGNTNAFCYIEIFLVEKEPLIFVPENGLKGRVMKGLCFHERKQDWASYMLVAEPWPVCPSSWLSAFCGILWYLWDTQRGTLPRSRLHITISWILSPDSEARVPQTTTVFTPLPLDRAYRVEANDCRADFTLFFPKLPLPRSDGNACVPPWPYAEAFILKGGLWKRGLWVADAMLIEWSPSK